MTDQTDALARLTQASRRYHFVSSLGQFAKAEEIDAATPQPQTKQTEVTRNRRLSPGPRPAPSAPSKAENGDWLS